MTALMLHAIGLARCGEWLLLDSLEVVARAKDEPKLAGVLHVRGSATLLGYAVGEVADEPSDCKCEECEGDGEITVEGATGKETWVRCPWCYGDGYTRESDAVASRFDSAFVKSWKTLDGNVVKGDFDKASGWIDRATAKKTVDDYTKIVERLAA